MTTAAPRRHVIMQYRAEDFPLYLLSLVLGGILIVPVLPHRWEQVLLVASLLYLACFFLIRHGAKFPARVFRDVWEGVSQYPGMLFRSWKTALHGVIPIAVIFAVTLALERYLRPMLAGTRWLEPFPWQWAIWGPFLVVTLFRVTILVAHLLRGRVIREVLERSPQRKSIAVLPIHQHVIQAFITGMLAHLSLVAPCVLFFMWTNPPLIRETLLFSGFLIWTAIARPLRKRKILVGPGVINNRLVYQNHVIAHHSRFFFTVFHGHHHDAIPSALIGSAAGTGFLENTDRGITWLDPLNSIIVVQLNWMYVIAFDMVVHQYLPGVFPFAKTTVVGISHHVTHHFGSAMPLGIIFSGYIEPGDMSNGYKPDNPVTRWFLSEVERLEGLDPEHARKFLTLNDWEAKQRAKAEKAAPPPVEPIAPAPAPVN